jgi:hypothetical protein
MTITAEQNAKLWDMVCEFGQAVRDMEAKAAQEPNLTCWKNMAADAKREYDSAMTLFLNSDVED